MLCKLFLSHIINYVKYDEKNAIIPEIIKDHGFAILWHDIGTVPAASQTIIYQKELDCRRTKSRLKFTCSAIILDPRLCVSRTIEFYFSGQCYLNSRPIDVAHAACQK